MEPLLYALYLGLLFIAFQTIVFILNTGQLTTLPSISSEYKSKISILIPARNEEISIRKCLTSTVNQNYLNYEVIILDDNSTDKTPDILNQIKLDHPKINFSIINGKPKPDKWLGKNWACHQLSQKATGEVLVFIDADTHLESNFLESVNTAITVNKLEALTVWPHQVMETFWEKVVIPQMYYVIYTLLPIKYTYSDPKWMPKTLIPKFRSSFAAACGQCMVFTKDAYNSIGGHESIKDQVVEDVELARIVRGKNMNFRMFHGNNTFNCRMYSSEPEIVQGFRKNFLAGFGNNIPLFIFSWILHLCAYVVPWIGLLVGIGYSDTTLTTLSTALIVLPVLIRLKMDTYNKWSRANSVLHILGILWFNRLAIIVLIDRLTGRKANWKNRSV